MDLAALSSRLARRWWLVAGLAVLAALGAATASTGKSDEHRTEIEFVLRPDASVTNDDLPGTLEALKSDGTLVPTVVGVLNNRALLRRAAADADVTLTPAYTLDASAQPGSTLVDAALTGPDGTVLNRLVAGYAREASLYVAASYPAYVLDRLSVSAGASGGGPGTAQIVVVALLLGAALGVALVAAELRLEPKLRQARASAPEPEPEPEPPAAAPPERQPVVRQEPAVAREEPPVARAETTDARGAHKTNGKPERPARAADSNRRSLSGPSPVRFRPGPVRDEEED
jgi:hypothetical protein